MLGLAAVAAELSVDSIINLGLEPNPNPLLLEAVGRSGSKIEHSFFKGFGDLPEKVQQGHLNNIKGKYFEVLTAHKLNAGESVGELGKLSLGHVAELADSQNQAVWDLKINNESGEPVRFLQAKATIYLGPVKDALTKSPGTPVFVPADFPTETDGIEGQITRTDITNASLEEVTNSQVNELGESTLADLIDKGAEIGFDMIPILSRLCDYGDRGARSPHRKRYSSVGTTARGATASPCDDLQQPFRWAYPTSSARRQYRPLWQSESPSGGSVTRWRWAISCDPRPKMSWPSLANLPREHLNNSLRLSAGRRVWLEPPGAWIPVSSTRMTDGGRLAAPSAPFAGARPVL